MQAGPPGVVVPSPSRLRPVCVAVHTRLVLPPVIFRGPRLASAFLPTTVDRCSLQSLPPFAPCFSPGDSRCSGS